MKWARTLENHSSLNFLTWSNNKNLLSWLLAVLTWSSHFFQKKILSWKQDGKNDLQWEFYEISKPTKLSISLTVYVFLFLKTLAQIVLLGLHLYKKLFWKCPWTNDNNWWILFLANMYISSAIIMHLGIHFFLL